MTKKKSQEIRGINNSDHQHHLFPNPSRFFFTPLSSSFFLFSFIFGLLPPSSHVTPPMGPLDNIKSSALADAAGWVDVSPSTLQHTKFSNVFSLGDCSSLPTSKTAAAITAQTPVVVENLSSLMNTGKIGTASYDGYTSCPLFTGYGQLMLAEFVYGAKPKETFGSVWDQRIPNRAFYHMGKDVFPYAYWNHMVKGEFCRAPSISSFFFSFIAGGASSHKTVILLEESFLRLLMGVANTPLSLIYPRPFLFLPDQVTGTVLEVLSLLNTLPQPAKNKSTVQQTPECGHCRKLDEDVSASMTIILSRTCLSGNDINGEVHEERITKKKKKKKRKNEKRER